MAKGKHGALEVLKNRRMTCVEYLHRARYYRGSGFLGLFRQFLNVNNGEIDLPMGRHALLLFLITLLVQRSHFQAFKLLHLVRHARTHLIGLVFPPE